MPSHPSVADTLTRSDAVSPSEHQQEGGAAPGQQGVVGWERHQLEVAQHRVVAQGISQRRCIQHRALPVCRRRSSSKVSLFEWLAAALRH